jgi:hypothetical protein
MSMFVLCRCHWILLTVFSESGMQAREQWKGRDKCLPTPKLHGACFLKNPKMVFERLKKKSEQ